MRLRLEGFQFVEEVKDFTDSDARIARIPSGLRSPKRLLEILSRELSFPAYFGGNWDALEECLRDLHWLGMPRRIVIVHESVPFSSNPKQRAIYLEILKDAMASWKAGDPHEIVAVFPQSAEQMIAATLQEGRPG